MQNLGFSDHIIHWYTAHKRDLPWRQTTDPYTVWLSEIILQQTRVDQGMSYFLRILEAFPTVDKMAQASEDQVLKLWQGLGYYSRARNMHATAIYVHTQCNGNFPNRFADLLKLKGVGPYTAAAIASFCFQEPVAVVDGNVERVLARFFGIDEPVDDTAVKKKMQQLAQEMLSLSQPDIHNQAIMEFGALQCTPQAPACGNCVLAESCVAYRAQRVGQLPFKARKTKVLDVYLDYIVLTDGKALAFRKRSDTGIWRNLHDFVSIEAMAPHTEEARLATLQKWGRHLLSSEPTIHLLSHRKMHIQFHWVLVKSKKIKVALIWQDFQEWDQVAVPKPVVSFLEGTDWSTLRSLAKT
jgi:A/G-specific adenine glycosylase